jgi:alginate O-acetyltransferase complex protein AlgJ
MRHLLSRSMMFAALALLWLPVASYGWNAAAPNPWRSKYLNGAPVTYKLSERKLETFIDRSLQDSVAKAFGPSMPFFNDIVRLHNEIVYAGIGISPSHHILIGKNEYLHNPVYLNAYCRRDLAASADTLRQWAQEIRDIQDIITARGQIFLYVLTPSKIEHIPDTLPTTYPCRSEDRQRFVPTVLSYLDAVGVTYVDATASMDDVQEKYGYDPFPKYGIHWTNLAAYPATLDIIQAINRATGKPTLASYDIAVSPAKQLFPMDHDYARLLNVLSTPTPPDTATFSVTTPAPRECPPPLSILTVGGSFFQALGANLSLAPCPPKVEHLFYLSFDTYRYESGQLKGTGTADYALHDRAEIVIVEENIGVLPAKHIPVYHQFLRSGRRPNHRTAGLVGE